MRLRPVSRADLHTDSLAERVPPSPGAIFLAALLLALVVPAGASAAPTCMGKPATIVGTAGNDKLVGTDHRDVIVGLKGGDKIYGEGGDDLICGGDGGGQFDDDIDGGPGDDVIHTNDGKTPDYINQYDLRAKGGPGNDKIYGESHGVHLYGGGGHDYLQAGDGSWIVIFGGGGNDTLAAVLRNQNGGNDEFYGQAGDDTLKVQAGSVPSGSLELAGGGGADHIVGGDGVDTVYGGDVPAVEGQPSDPSTGPDEGDEISTAGGADEVDAGPGDNVVNTGDGADHVASGDGADRISAGEGNDRVKSGDAKDTIDAGGGADHVDAGGGPDSITGGGGGDVLSGQAGADSATAGAGDDLLSGGTENDSLLGGGGTDHCSGESGSDSCDGGAPTPADPSTDPDICDTDVENPSDCRTPGAPASWTGTFNGTQTLTNSYQDLHWTFNGNVTYALKGTSSDHWDYALTGGSVTSSVSGTSFGCSESGSGTVPLKHSTEDPAYSYMSIHFLQPGGWYSAWGSPNGQIDITKSCPGGSYPDHEASVAFRSDLPGAQNWPAYGSDSHVLSGSMSGPYSDYTYSVNWTLNAAS